jgi:hypothetical protein
MGTVRLYIHNLLYPTETFPNNPLNDNRMMLADMSANMALRESIKQNMFTNATFPFTVYTIGNEIEKVDRTSHTQHTGHIIPVDLGIAIKTLPVEVQLNMISFFNTAADYNHAQVLFLNAFADKILLDVPVILNGQLCKTYVLLHELELSKGSYAYEFEQQLKEGNIWDLVHNFKIVFLNIVLDASMIAPVDDILVGLVTLKEFQTPITSRTLVPETPQVKYTIPISGSVDVSVNSTITVGFNTSMNTNEVEQNIGFIPSISSDYSWISGDSVLIITPSQVLNSGTAYELSIGSNSISGQQVRMIQDYDFVFTTKG